MPSPYRSMKDDSITQSVRVRLSPDNWKRVKKLADMGDIFDNEFISLAVEFALTHVSVRPQPKKLMEWYFGEESSTEDKMILPGVDELEPEKEEDKP